MWKKNYQVLKQGAYLSNSYRPPGGDFSNQPGAGNGVYPVVTLYENYR